MKSQYTLPEGWATVDTIEMTDKFEGLPVYVVSRLAVRRRGQGYAKKLMQMVCDDADMEQVALALSVVPGDETVSEDRLIEFYERYGFVLHDFAPWQKLDADMPRTMARLPVWPDEVTS